MRNWIRYVDNQIGHLIQFNWRHGLHQRAQAISEHRPISGQIPGLSRKVKSALEAVARASLSDGGTELQSAAVREA